MTPAGHPPAGRDVLLPRPHGVRWRRSRFALGAVPLLAAALVGPLFSSSSSATSTSVGGLRAEAQAIARQLDTLQVKIQILGEAYDRATERQASLRVSIGADLRSLRSSQRAVAHNGVLVRQQAVEAYVTGGSTSSLSSLLSSSASSLPLQQTYLEAAASGLDEAVSHFQDAEHRLGVRKLVLDQHESEATATASALSSERSQAQRLDQQLVAEEASVKGKLAAAVQAQELAQLAAARAAAAAAAQAAAAQAAAAQSATTTAPAPVRLNSPIAPSQPTASQPTASQPTASTSTSQPGASTVVPIAGGGSGVGEAAVRAAESQIGVPYVWAGSTPGEGFDCSGLTMWAWSQAGVDLPHSAQAQYDSIEHVSASQLQPGDLIFYASGGYIYHVIMYIGNGQAVQAEDTGTDIQITPVWPGAYGYGQP